jgi:hypothetical protein
MRLPTCSGDKDTVVFCHINVSGLSLKAPDLFGFYGCYSCHQAYDLKLHNYDPDWLNHQALEAMKRTQEILLEKGLISI